MDFLYEYRIYKVKLEASLRDMARKEYSYPQSLKMAIDYSLLDGGKRLRPVLFLSVFDKLYGGDLREALPIACAIEMIHIYSLIHDDLPCMDNDDYRRGKLTNHKVFGEGMAVLAGDGILNRAYEVMLVNALKYPSRLTEHLKTISFIAESVGIEGMIGGQAADLQSQQGAVIDAENLEYIHRNKTSKLIEASVVSAAILAGSTNTQIDALKEYGKSIGFAFQIVDDVLDHKFPELDSVCSCSEQSSYATLFGVNASQERAALLVRNASEALDVFGEKKQFFIELANYIENRKT